MFNWFGKSKTEVAYKDWVWMSKAAKYEGLYRMLQQNPQEKVVFVSFFQQSMLELEFVFTNTGIAFGRLSHTSEQMVNTVLASDIAHVLKPMDKIVFVEHYPIFNVEQDVVNRLYSKSPSSKLFFAISLDDPLLNAFNGGRIVELMSKLGLDPKEMLEHNMITTSIMRAQEAVTKKASDFPAQSAQEWFEKNFKL